MRILLVEPGKVPRTAEIGDSLEAMQTVVGGSIQAVYPFEEPVALVCNEESCKQKSIAEVKKVPQNLHS